jgi:hypothetical protein
MGRWLGLKNFDRRNVRYWIDQGVFPAPVASVEGVISLYKNNGDLDLGFINIGKRMRVPTELTFEDIKMAKKAILEKIKSENIDQLFLFVSISFS